MYSHSIDYSFRDVTHAKVLITFRRCIPPLLVNDLSNPCCWGGEGSPGVGCLNAVALVEDIEMDASTLLVQRVLGKDIPRLWCEVSSWPYPAWEAISSEAHVLPDIQLLPGWNFVLYPVMVQRG